MPSMAGLLIVNADDWGIDAATTDAIAACFAAGRVTSATAMVFMADSERAAELAQQIGLPLGLHLNLSEPYTGQTAPDAVRRRQAELTRRFGDRARRWRRWLPDPTIRTAVERCVKEQLAAFELLYGHRPTHVDGHKHVQVSPSVARTAALRDLPLRRAFSDPTGARSPIATARRARHRWALARDGATAHLLPISSMRDDLLAGREPALLAPAHDEPLEVMAHPGLAHERALLMSDTWADALRRFRLGTYEDLA